MDCVIVLHNMSSSYFGLCHEDDILWSVNSPFVMRMTPNYHPGRLSIFEY
jgi:hypothetical protein